MKIRFVEPVASDVEVADLAAYFTSIKRPGCEIEIVTLPAGGRPVDSLEYYSIEALAHPDIVRIAHDSASRDFDGLLIGCFYDPALVEAREISGNMLVMAPCLAALQVAAHISNRVSILVGRRKWMGRIGSLVREYGYEHSVASLRPTNFFVKALTDKSLDRFSVYRDVGQRAIDEDGAEAIILGCTMNFNMANRLQDALKVPVIDPIASALLKLEAAIEGRDRFGWGPSRIGTCEAPPLDAATLEILRGDGSSPVGRSAWVR